MLIESPSSLCSTFCDEDVDDDDDDKVGPVDDVDQMLSRRPTHLNPGQLSQARTQLLNTTQPDHPRLSLSLAVIIICHHLPSSRQLFIFSNFCSSSRLFFSLSSWLSAIAHLKRWPGQSSQVLDNVDIHGVQQLDQVKLACTHLTPSFCAAASPNKGSRKVSSSSVRRNTFQEFIKKLGVRHSLFKLEDNTMIYRDTLLSHRTRLLPGQSSRCRQVRCPGQCCTRPVPAQAAVVQVWWMMQINDADQRWGS